MSKTYDVAVVGGGLTGLLAALQFEKQGKSVAIIEQRDRLGGNLAAETLGATPLHCDFEFARQSEMPTLEWIESALQTGIGAESIILERKTWEGLKTIPFVGFGDTRFESMDDLTYLQGEDFVQLRKNPAELVAMIAERLKAEVFLNTQVTGVEKTGDRVTGLILNDGDALKADHFVFCLSPKVVLPWLPTDPLPHRWGSKALKSNTWWAVKLHTVFSKPVEDTQTLFVSMPGKKDESEPAIGRFYNTDGNCQSLWMTFLSAAQAEDAESMGQLVKFLKRSALKAAQSAEGQTVKSEKISVQQEWFGHVPWSEEERREYSQATNVQLASRMFYSNMTPFAASIQAALDLSVNPAADPTIDSTTQL